MSPTKPSVYPSGPQFSVIVTLAWSMIGCGAMSVYADPPADASAITSDAGQLQPTREQSTREQSTRELSTREQSTRDQWTLARGDSAQTGSVDVVVAESLKLGWEYRGGEAFEVPPLVYGESVYVADVMGTIHAIDRQTGNERWTKKIDTIFTAPPALYVPQANDSKANDSKSGISKPANSKPSELNQNVADDDPDRGLKIILGDVDGIVYAIGADGEEQWRYETDGSIDASPNFRGDVVLMTSQDGQLHAINVADGTRRWTYETGDQLRCAATVVGNQTYLGGCDAALHRVRLDNGKADGAPISIDGPTGSTPAYVADYRDAADPQPNQPQPLVVLPIMSGLVYGIDPSAGRIVWEYYDDQSEQEYRTDAAVWGDRAIVVSARRNVDAIDLKTGRRLWRQTIRRKADASPIISRGDVWVAASDGRLYRFDLADGREKWKYEIRGSFLSSPAITRDGLYIADEDGVVRKFVPE